jgi:hypothetical protein
VKKGDAMTIFEVLRPDLPAELQKILAEDK